MATDARAKTSYVILERDADGGWQFVNNAEASSAAEALRITVKTAGTYVAIPARSFVPSSVQVEQTTIVKVG